jgi:hypothetical protein
MTSFLPSSTTGTFKNKTRNSTASYTAKTVNLTNNLSQSSPKFKNRTKKLSISSNFDISSKEIPNFEISKQKLEIA